jgi:hypothetical protein
MQPNGKLRLALAAVAGLFGVTGAPTAKAQAQKPNIVFVLVDNVGWGAFGAYGGTVCAA